ncbi:MAG: L-threonylcarbamoyladenylate synthase [Candidatus Nitrosopumilus limneticus]|nr:Sua5 YciO YrdC YwlC family protein [Candidatus Nitrosopumilus limneticus]MDC4212198.1 L-threonylcarbamoyladenylate synthase [Candidatus Nitrosopumilus limneticus]MDC4214824.1 L-threonylcarbamoyladenylate synthase [Candidatus Nitrosopumilus limneticus]MDC4216601.1 L-threonylcarbamoyladenylate synthase [Candidatus Nitrosopumilus limneticus]MDC4218096.1 L-threonylcarbamoyladenylate synthase [Candidatus Nitrosopumilus limneticus]
MKVDCNEEGIKKTHQIFQKGGIIVFPTDTVYGIGCDPYNQNSIKKIYEIKSREKVKSLPILAYSLDIVKKIVVIDEFTEKIIQKNWPGPLTLILELTDEKLKKSLNLQNKIAVRIPDSKCTLKLLEKCKLIVGTSANISGNSSYTNPDECIKNIKNYDLFLNGGTIRSKGESTIIEVENKTIKIIREGALKMEDILI